MIKLFSVRLGSKKQWGFTLVELMISLVLGLIVVAGAIQLFVSTQKTYQQAMALSQRQGALRFVSDVLLLDVRTSHDLQIDPTIELADATEPPDLSSCLVGLANYTTAPESKPEAVAGVMESSGRILRFTYRASRRNDPICDQADYPHLYQMRYFAISEGEDWQLASCQICRKPPVDDNFEASPAADELQASAVIPLQRNIEALFEEKKGISEAGPIPGAMSIKLVVPAPPGITDELVENRTFTFTAVERDELVSLLGLNK
ncbi:PilW family protein [Halomonas sp.]|uniref:PilW family protein n=1 Tax=Halomonas sp. TaxID=1486246 RepID=UPI00384E4AED